MEKLFHPMPADRKPFRVLFICMGGLLVDYCVEKEATHVPDPYYGGPQGFEEVADLVEDACGGLLEEIRRELR